MWYYDLSLRIGWKLHLQNLLATLSPMVTMLSADFIVELSVSLKINALPWQSLLFIFVTNLTDYAQLICPKCHISIAINLPMKNQTLITPRQWYYQMLRDTLRSFVKPSHLPSSSYCGVIKKYTSRTLMFLRSLLIFLWREWANP